MNKPPLTTDQHNRLIHQLVALLSANGTNVRGFIDMRGKTLPCGPNSIQKLLKRYHLEGVRAELAGTTLSVEITTARQGIQVDDVIGDGTRYATSDFYEFQFWFCSMLRRSGIEPIPSGPVSQPSKPMGTVKMDLRSKPYINRKQSRR